ncbi:O-antigen ligase family protein [Polynucleobacter sp. JS-JIR-II-c23]|uniref:O-antigen ligase family protein n=1 Tax=Polynucleobacter sp. JS-JIR-II-c23 TaxID=1758393 RepID=UPI002B2377F0|nr:O-antigen ligase family protein [Polynucleobacter sp. JS-JIR-II-c23]MEA9604646.1 O-antigen ligase family protein [Polynucleobacter sp. JS-JIR-II-c23]
MDSQISQSHPQRTMQKIPYGIVLMMCVLFALLYGVWILPHTVFIRHFAMGLGSLLGLWVIYQNRFLLWQKRALPTALIFLLLIWVTIHLFWIGRDYPLQSLEYAKIWKKIALSLPFALGLGLAIASNYSDLRKSRRYWQIIYLGFCLPTIIYFGKFAYAKLAGAYGYPIPSYLLLVPYGGGEQPFGIPRAWYVLFCLPAFAIALGRIVQFIEQGNFGLRNSWFYLAILPLTVALFFIETDRFGMVYVMIFLALSLGIILFKYFKRLSWSGGVILLSVAAVSLGLVSLSVSKNPQWQTLVADSKVAAQIDRYDNWKNRNKGYPINELGQVPSDSNYSRLAWATVGSRLLIENPLGYGLMSLSFAALGKEKWPDSDLSWTHSAWLDFGLGYGLPGLLLLVLAVISGWFYSIHSKAPWSLIGRWGLASMALVMTTKEVSAESGINAIIFLVLWVSALSINNSNPDAIPK